MTGIERIGWPVTVRGSSRAAGGSAFRVNLEPASNEAPSGATATSAPVLTSMLSLQEFGGETVRDREARRHGEDMMAALADLQRALLSATEDPSVLDRLTELVASVPRATDHRLAALVSAIVVRVRVELARRRP